MTLIVWVFCREDGSALVLGEKDEPDGNNETVQAQVTRELWVARRWATAMRAGRVPADGDDTEPPPSPQDEPTLSAP